MNLLMIGCGAMGQAMLVRWLDTSWLQHVTIIKPSPLPVHLASHARIAYHANVAQCTLAHYDTLLWAVKPQMMADAFNAVQSVGDVRAHLHISIAAALPLAWYEERLGINTRIVRAMPNTPVSLGLGVTGLTANAALTDKDRLMVEEMMQSLGSAYWLHSESEMNLFTAIAGCGPAYVYAWVDAWCMAAAHYGMPYEDARHIISQTMRGAMALSDSHADVPLATLTARVTSKGGMTEAALQQLNKNHQWHEGFIAAFNEAMNRAQALST